jgi:uncharacterized protein YbjT (DUF2867 family)
MTAKLKVLVTGATGKQGGHLVSELLARGHTVRALARNPESPAAVALAERGVRIVPGNFDDQGSLERAARGVDTVFAMSTPFGGGEKAETREGINILHAASNAGVTHLVYSSVAGADRASGIPHFDSKFEVEKEIRRSGIPFTIVAPVFFMENFLAEWMAAGIAKGSIAIAMPATRRLQQIAVADIAQFTALVIESRESFLGQRIDIASDELTLATVAALITEETGRHVAYVRCRSRQCASRTQISRGCTSGSTAWDTMRMSSGFGRAIRRSTGIASTPGCASRSGQPPSFRRQCPDEGRHRAGIRRAAGVQRCSHADERRR